MFISPEKTRREMGCRKTHLYRVVCRSTEGTWSITAGRHRKWQCSRPSDVLGIRGAVPPLIVSCSIKHRDRFTFLSAKDVESPHGRRQGEAFAHPWIIGKRSEFKRETHQILMRKLNVWSEFLATDPEVPGSIPGAYRLSEKQWVWNRVHSASWGQLRSYLKEK
jgi:hypothetical protein